jgi:glyoxylase-like metal-dependent hydrolase (beta-lactamase superfamily II)
MAQTDGLVGGAFKEAATAKVTVQNLRRNISVLLGAGGKATGSTPSHPPRLVQFSPTVFKDEHTLHVNNMALMLKHYSPAHTDSDISVYFPEADILHTGDTFWNRDYPFIDYGTGGSIDGQIRAAEANIAKVTNKTIVIPGHGAVGGSRSSSLPGRVG